MQVEPSRRQLQLALGIIITLIPIGTIGMMVLNHSTLGEAFYFTIVTLGTVGYGDVVPTNDAARLFVAILIPFGLSAFAFALQAIYFSVFANPALIEIRARRQIRRAIARLNRHYVLCGSGELVSQTVDVLKASARRKHVGRLARVWQSANALIGRTINAEHLLDTFVVVTADSAYASWLRASGVLVIYGAPDDENTLLQTGITRAQALLAMSDDDTATLLTVMTARALNKTLLITATILDESLSYKMIQVGANQVVAPYVTAGAFLNNATLRPAVSTFFNSIAFDLAHQHDFLELQIAESSPWINQPLEALNLVARFDVYVIGIRHADELFSYIIRPDYRVQADDCLLIVGKLDVMPQLGKEARTHEVLPTFWQVLPIFDAPFVADKKYSLAECTDVIAQMNKHFIICGTGNVAERVLAALDPARPFVIVSDDMDVLNVFLARGFRVVHGNPRNQQVLIRAGARRAQAIMITLEDEAQAVLTILTARTLNKQLLITAAAYHDPVVRKLERAGADRVVSPFHIAARFMLLATTTPDISDFIRHVMFNHISGLETTELYMETDSPWIGRTIASLTLDTLFEAHVVSIWHADRHNFAYAPPGDTVIEANEVLIVITPMQHADVLRDLAHASDSKRPTTLRTRVVESAVFSAQDLQRFMKTDN